MFTLGLEREEVRKKDEKPGVRAQTLRYHTATTNSSGDGRGGNPSTATARQRKRGNNVEQHLPHRHKATLRGLSGISVQQTANSREQQSSPCLFSAAAAIVKARRAFNSFGHLYRPGDDREMSFELAQELATTFKGQSKSSTAVKSVTTKADFSQDVDKKIECLTTLKSYLKRNDVDVSSLTSWPPY